MGLRGPIPKSKILEIAQGRPGKRPADQHEPQYRALTLAEIEAACPKRLTKGQRSCWRYYAKMYGPKRVIADTDLMMLEKLAILTDERVALEKQLQIAGQLYKYPRTGTIGPNPIRSMVTASRDMEAKLLREFGGSPLSRPSVSAIVEQTGIDPVAEAIFG